MDGMSRRRFGLKAMGAVAGVMALGSTGVAEGKEVEVSPGEDLMREHGLLRRMLLLDDETVRRLGAGQSVPWTALQERSRIIRRFVHDYHEKLEEEFVFPRFPRGALGALVGVLRQQHERGRQNTAAVLYLSRRGASLGPGERQELASLLASFGRMYRAHASREDTVLFGALHERMGEKAWHELGERFEQRERKALGRKGFEGVLREVEGLERQLGLHDLSRYTPKAR